MQQIDLKRSKFYFPALVLVCWTVFGLFFGIQNFLRDAYFGKGPSLPGYLVGWLLCGYSWAILTFPVFKFVRTFSFVRLKWLRFFAIHIPSAVVFSIAQLGIYDLIAQTLFHGGGRGFIEYYGFLLANEFQSSFLVYFAVIGAITAYDDFFVRATGVSTTRSDVAGPADDPGISTPNGNGHSRVRRISIKENGRILLLDVDDIDWITSEGNYVQLHTPKKKYLIRETMNNMEAKLDGSEFVRVRRSTIIRVAEIKEFHPTFNGEFEVILRSGTKLASSRRYRKNLEYLLGA
ncbi:MAG: LytTR family DNA-binding domain-containing protein [Acidobacteriota bacterium]